MSSTQSGAESDTASLPHVSIVIANHNYARFLSGAIESALAQTHPDCDVIVVDDGSTDDSAAVIARYDRIQPVLQSNRGQAGALNAGFARTSGSIVIFLDADDRLDPHAAETVARVLHEQPGVAKVMYRLRVIDEAGVPTGEIKPAPHLPLRSGDVTPYVLRFPFDMVWMATSGNAFRAGALREVFPIPEDEYPICADWYLSHLTPLFGAVVFLDEICGSYRVHRANRYERSDRWPDLPQMRDTIVYAHRTAAHIATVAYRTGVASRQLRDDELASVSDVWQRLFSLRWDPQGHPLPDDTRRSLISLGVFAARRRFDVAPALRVLMGAWILVVAFAPRRLLPAIAHAFASWRDRGPVASILGSLHRR